MKPSSLLLIGLLCVNANLHAQSATNAGVASATNSPTIDILMQQYQPLAASLHGYAVHGVAQF